MKNPRSAVVALLALLLAHPSFAALETWTDLDGRSMEAEFISASSTYVSFRKADGTRYIFPVEKLSEADQARVRALTGKTSDADKKAAPAPTPEPKPAPVVAGKFTNEIAGKLVSYKGGSLSPVNTDAVKGTRFYAVYYSAQWCPPCRGFTPTLVESYKKLKAKNPDFELVFVSIDRDADAMKTYMKEYKMPWPALRHDLARSLPTVGRVAGRGIPHLVFMTADGEVLSSSYVNGKYVGPQKVLADIQKKLADKS